MHGILREPLHLPDFDPLSGELHPVLEYFLGFLPHSDALPVVLTDVAQVILKFEVKLLHQELKLIPHAKRQRGRDIRSLEKCLQRGVEIGYSLESLGFKRGNFFLVKLYLEIIKDLVWGCYWNREAVDF